MTQTKDAPHATDIAQSTKALWKAAEALRETSRQLQQESHQLRQALHAARSGSQQTTAPHSR
jgi:hypothetical protein